MVILINACSSFLNRWSVAKLFGECLWFIDHNILGIQKHERRDKNKMFYPCISPPCSRFYYVIKPFFSKQVALAVLILLTFSYCVKLLRVRQDDVHFADDIFWCILCMKILEICFIFYWHIFPGAQRTIIHYCSAITWINSCLAYWPIYPSLGQIFCLHQIR